MKSGEKMSLKIVRNDITKMHTEAIVNTASADGSVGPGCDKAVYEAAGFEELVSYRKEHVGKVKAGDAFITPGFGLEASYIIHAVSPRFKDGKHGEEGKLRSCYRNSLALVKANGIKSVAFPLISTGSFGYPKEEGLRIAVDEINAFLLTYECDLYLVVFDEGSTKLGRKLCPGLESYINSNYVDRQQNAEYGTGLLRMRIEEPDMLAAPCFDACNSAPVCADDFYEDHESKLKERLKHLSDTFSEYLLFLIKDKGMTNAEVYKRAIVDKKVFSKIKNNADYHPEKMTAMCLCVGAKLNIDEATDLLARAGYALSPCDKTDVIFSYFLENEIYDMIELDIQLEEHGLKCLIS